jgi:hypothetical protein
MRTGFLYTILFLAIVQFSLAQDSSRCFWGKVVGTSDLFDSSSLKNVYILDKPHRDEWQKRRNTNCQSDNPDDCLVWCQVELPKEYRLEQVYTSQHQLFEALCPDQITEDVIRQIQESLSWHGSYSGEISGRWDRTTEKGMADYQKKHGLQIGYMTKESMTHLDIMY